MQAMVTMFYLNCFWQIKKDKPPGYFIKFNTVLTNENKLLLNLFLTVAFFIFSDDIKAN